jgi:serine/threonine protein kinase
MLLEKDTLFDNRYRLINLRGRGAFGEVWQARDEQMNIEVAVKIYIALDERGIEEFKNEFRVVFGLSHPNLLHASYFGQCDHQPYLVMPFCPNSAATLVGRCDENTVWRFIRDVTSGLAYLHNEDIIHHDIKPDNVLIDYRGNFLISDFGISTKLRTTFQRHSRLQNRVAPGGSMAYMAPELFSLSAEAVKATDIWALGATLYEMVTGELPFFGQGGVIQLNGGMLDRPQVNYSDALIDTILECLAKETWNRPKANELAVLAQDMLYHHSPPQPPKAPDPVESGGREDEESLPPDNEPGNNKPVHKNKTWLIVLIALLIGGLGFLIGWWLTQRSSGQQAEQKLFERCITANDYRTYLALYPDGKNAEFAKTKLAELVADSTAKAIGLEKVDPTNNEPKPEPKPDEKGKKEKDKGKDIDKGKDKNKDNNLEKSNLRDPIGGLDDDNNDRLAPISKPHKPQNKGGGLTPVTPGGGGKANLTPTQSAPALNEEEAYKRCLRSNSFEACADYLDKWGEKGKKNEAHFKSIQQLFANLYKAKAKSCSTKEECEKFLKEHDRIMKRVRMAGSAIDT